MERKLLVWIPLVVFAGVVFALPDDQNATSPAVENEPEHEETFLEMEKRIKTSFGNGIKMLLPYMLRDASNAHISGACTASIIKVIGGVRNLKEWAIRFIDASGKIPPGLLEGTTFSIGDYDECLNIAVGRRDEVPQTPEETIFQGKYCLLDIHRHEAINRALREFEKGNTDQPIAKTKTFLNMFVKYRKLNNSTMKIGLCVPSKCSAEDVENILGSDSIRNFLGNVTVPYCKQKGEEKMTTTQLILLCFFGFFVGCIILGTLIDAFLRLKGDDLQDSKSEQQSYSRLIIAKTSLYSNALTVLNTNTTEAITCLCGIRPIIVMIIIYSHTYAHLHILHFQKFSKALNFLRFFDSFTFAGIGNGSVTLDTMVFISAVTISYTRWRHVAKDSQVKLNFTKLFLQRYFRLSAAQLLCICLFMLLPLMGSGPFWSAYVDPMLNNCRQRWWLNILYIHNFWTYSDLCLYHTWILSLFMQLTLVGMIALWILKKSMAFGILFMIIMTLSGVIGVAVMTVIHDLPGSLAFFMLNIRTFPIAWNDVFALPYDHIGPFCVGLITGYYLAVKKDRLDISKVTSIALWCSSIAIGNVVMFGLYRYRNGEPMDLPLSVFYAMMHRTVWCIGFAWFVIACTTHHGGAVSRLLKSKTFRPLDRLCYMAYIVHMQIIYFHSGRMRERFYMGHFELLLQAIAYIVLAFVASFLLHIIFVEPFYAFEEHVCCLFRPRDKVVFQSKSDLKEVTIPNGLTAVPEKTSSKNECVHLGYSKKLDGF